MTPEGTRGRAVVGILTITQEEFQAVKRAFKTDVDVAASPYWVRALAAAPAGGKPTYDVVVRHAHEQANLNSSDVAREFIEHFRPEYLLLVGTAGGHSKRDVAVGDVVIADFVEDSEYFKLSEGKAVQRKRPYDHPSYELREVYAQQISKKNDWRKHVFVKRPRKGTPRAVIANLASGDKLLANPRNSYQKFILDYFDKAAAFEMEGFGVASQIYKQRTSVSYNPQYLIVRGISDLVNKAGNQSMRVRWRKYAAAAAAAFAKELVDKVLQARASVAE